MNSYSGYLPHPSLCFGDLHLDRTGTARSQTELLWVYFNHRCALNLFPGSHVSVDHVIFSSTKNLLWRGSCSYPFLQSLPTFLSSEKEIGQKLLELTVRADAFPANRVTSFHNEMLK